MCSCFTSFCLVTFWEREIMNTQLTPEQQQTANIDRIRVIHAKVKRTEYLDKIFDDSDKAQELDFDEDVH